MADKFVPVLGSLVRILGEDASVYTLTEITQVGKSGKHNRCTLMGDGGIRSGVAVSNLAAPYAVKDEVILNFFGLTIPGTHPANNVGDPAILQLAKDAIEKDTIKAHSLLAAACAKALVPIPVVTIIHRILDAFSPAKRLRNAELIKTIIVHLARVDSLYGGPNGTKN
jgi:hypothetical protein